MARIPSVASGLLEIGAPADGLVVGSPAWWAWLAQDDVRSFAFRSPEGNYTARKERRSRGGAYWVAYRMAAGRLHKAYLGKTDELTSARLAEAAATLATLVDAPAPSGSAAQARGTSEGLLILATKLFAPRPRRDLVTRPRLLERLDAGLDGTRCTLLAAPPGAGKTTLVAEWLSGLDRPVAWLALDERDQDAHQFVRYLIAAVQRIAPTCGRAALARLDAPPPPRTELVLTSLINDLAGLPEPCLLALDDYHLVRAPAVHEALVFLLEHLPPAVHLVIATREDPPLPLPRLRARGELTEVRAGDLRFTSDEATRFFSDSLGLGLSNEQVATLVERTEGWAAGLQLAGLALRDRPDPAAFVAAFAHGHRLAADYLMSEVLERQPPAIQRFLLATSVLDRFCTPLCDALLAPDDAAADAPAVASSQQVLAALEKSNLFLVPLDDEQRWFRYHHLFADALRARLAREADDSACSVHRRAGAWFAGQDLLPEAIQHALAAGALDDAADWIERLTPTVFADSSIHRLLDEWLAALPEPLLLARPRLCLGRAWLLLNRFPLTPAQVWVDAAVRALPRETTDDVRQLRGAVAATRAYLATFGSNESLEAARAWAEDALADLAPDDAGYRGAAGVSLGKSALARGEPNEAERAYGEAAAAARAAGLVHWTLVGTINQVSVQRIRGARRRALATGQAALAWAAERIDPAAPGMGVLSVLLADLLRDGNDLAAALPLAIDGLRALRLYEYSPPLAVIASLSVARLRLARAELEPAAAVLAEARPLVQYGPMTGLAPLLDAAEAQVQLARGDGAAAVAWASAAAPVVLRDLLRFSTHIYVDGIEAVAVAAARILAVQGWVTGDATLLRQAAGQLEPAGELAERHGLGWLRLKTLILRALIDDGLGHRDAALAALSDAVAQAEPEGYLRPFVDEGPPMAALLAGLRALERKAPDLNGAASTAFLDGLLAAFPGDTSAPRGTGTALVEPPSARELAVLRLLAAGCSNCDIAQELVLEQSTVKTHLVHLYGKLGVHSRTQAVARARELQLLD